MIFYQLEGAYNKPVVSPLVHKGKLALNAVSGDELGGCAATVDV